MSSNTESLQRKQFNRIIAEYEQHYDDPPSQEYRSRFWYDPLFEGVDLQGKSVLEAMCGSGQASDYLQAREARVTGLDIAELAVHRFEHRWPHASGLCASLIDAPIGDGSFDCVVVVAGLHHLHPFTDQAIDEIYRILKPGGSFFFVEAYAGSLIDQARSLWYSRDRRYFMENEAGIQLDQMKRDNAHRFDFISEKYGGNIAYYLVFQSLILRIPIGLKPLYAPGMLWLEGLITPLQTKRWSSFVLGHWRKR
ncbi:MAG: class I SAM-dependent methyltransferase [Chloroflexota bacterium]|nr:class I SAM-dependent methyltransferase [Chloroflexota bacterium]